MNRLDAAPTTDATKALTGINGFDNISDGGLPRGRVTLVEGAAGSGKTVFALQTLVHAARELDEPGIFVAFEESTERIRANAARFGWDLRALENKLYFLDAQPQADIIQSGSVEFEGMLAAIESKASQINARRIVFDAIDVVLAFMNDAADERRELIKLHDWLLKRDFTAIVTGKITRDGFKPAGGNVADFMQFMVDCSVLLRHDVVDGISQRNLRILKYRGSTFDENECPLAIGSSGLELAAIHKPRISPHVGTTERVSSGVLRLDTMLGGGYYRGASILITGFPGTAKTTLAGGFIEAACRRDERVLFVSFDSNASDVVRDLRSVNIDLARFVENGMLRMASARAATGSAEIHLVKLRDLAREHHARCIVIDPISALYSWNQRTVHSVVERLIDWTKENGITLLCTSLLGEPTPEAEGSPLQISTIADTWIHLSYQIDAGERNRGLSIIKSRGTLHSNQVRELMLSVTGVTLADTYKAGGVVLMGTLRWEKEQADKARHDETELSLQQRQLELDADEVDLEAQMRSIQRKLGAKRLEKERCTRSAVHDEDVLSLKQATRLDMRGADAGPSAAKNGR